MENKYIPHQGKQECERRVRQGVNGWTPSRGLAWHINEDDFAFTNKKLIREWFSYKLNRKSYD